MISKNIIAITPPRTGGSAFRQVWSDDTGGLSTWSYYAKRHAQEFQSTIKVGVVRDPIDRLRSVYNHFRFGKDKRATYLFKAHVGNPNKDTTFSDMIANLETLTGAKWAAGFFAPQAYYLFDNKGVLRVDQVVQTWEIDRQINYLLLREGKQIQKDIPHPNKSDYSKGGNETISDEEMAIISEAYKLDYELLFFQ